jgi:hypothetical protein
MMEVVRPHAVESPAAFDRGPQHVRDVPMVLGDEMQRPSRGRACALDQRREERGRVAVGKRVRRIEAEAVDTEIRRPVDGVGNEPVAHHGLRQTHRCAPRIR